MSLLLFPYMLSFTANAHNFQYEISIFSILLILTYTLSSKIAISLVLRAGISGTNIILALLIILLNPFLLDSSKLLYWNGISIIVLLLSNLFLVFHSILLYQYWKQKSIDYQSLQNTLSEKESTITNMQEQYESLKKFYEQKLLDRSFQLVTYMEKLEIQNAEIEKFNELIVNLLEGPNINEVLDTIFSHILTYYKADIAFLYFIDPNTNEFFPYRGITKNIPEIIKNFMENTRMPVSKEAGISYIVYRRKKTIYLENGRTKAIRQKESNSDGFFSQLLSSLYVPVLIRNEFHGIFYLASFHHSLNLNIDKLKFISVFTNQLAATIQKEKLLKEKEEEKKKAEKAKIEAENAKEEIEAINSLARSINENLELKLIMDKIMVFVESRYALKFYSLYLLDPKKNKVKMLEAKFPDYLSDNTKREIMQTAIPIDGKTGAHAFIYRIGKMVFFKNLNWNQSCPEEKFAIEHLKISSMVAIPLKVKGEIKGILSFYSPEKIHLHKNHLKTISSLGEQVAGIIHNSSLYKELKVAKEKSDGLLLSILPPTIAEELKSTGKVTPIIYDSATILFTDFVGFTKIAESLTPKQLLIELDGYFTFFDFICGKYNLEKLKTIGDAYMCVSGLPIANSTHAIDSCLAAIEFRDFVNRMKEVVAVSKEKMLPWELRIGLHTGPVIGGVVGISKFTYDIWGDSVNIASRIESSGSPGKVNISGSTYHLVKDFFECEYRGKVSAKNKGEIDMYFLNGIKAELSDNEERTMPNQKFYELYQKIQAGDTK